MKDKGNFLSKKTENLRKPYVMVKKTKKLCGRMNKDFHFEAWTRSWIVKSVYWNLELSDEIIEKKCIVQALHYKRGWLIVQDVIVKQTSFWYQVERNLSKIKLLNKILNWLYVLLLLINASHIGVWLKNTETGDKSVYIFFLWVNKLPFNTI